jgi:hypothetical protein
LAVITAKEYFSETPILLILLRKINKIGVSEILSAAEGGGILFGQPLF